LRGERGTPSREEAEPAITRRSATWISLIAVVSFVTALLLMAFGGDLSESAIAGPSYFSSSALGHRALGQFLEESGLTVRVRRSRRVLRGSPDDAVFLLEPGTGGAAGQGDYLKELTALRSSVPLVLVLPKWKGEPLETRDGLWVERVSLLDEGVVGSVLEKLAPESEVRATFTRTNSHSPRGYPCETAWGETLEAELIAPQFLEPSPDLEPIVSTPEGVLAGRLRSISSWALYVIADPDLLNNHGLVRRDNAAIVLRLLEKSLAARAVTFDEVIHGLGRETHFLAETLRFPLNLIVLHGLLLFSLILWAAGSSFGKPLPVPPRLMAGRRGLIENTAQLLGCRGHVRESAARYFEEVLEDVARHYQEARELSREKMLVEVQRLSDSRGRRVDLASLRESLKPSRQSRRSLEAKSVEIAQVLHRWRQEMIDVR
jgi:hypothetical protein